MMKINKEEFIKNYQNLTYEELAAKYSVSRSTVQLLARELKLSKPVGRKKENRLDLNK